MNILVTGAKGFVGKNLVENLKNIRDGKDRTRNIEVEEIFEYDIDSSPEELARYCRETDFVFHLAGVNRPKDKSEFMAGNYDTSAALLQCLKDQHNTCPVMLSSSVQASLSGRFSDSEYGRSKLAGEEIFFQYAADTGAKVLVYRFPNIFGKWCRPNYNSVVATFCYNIARDLPIRVDDPGTILTLVYIDDLMDELIAALEGREHRCSFREREGGETETVPDPNGCYCCVPATHECAVGRIAQLLKSFREIGQNGIMPEIHPGSFEKKLFSTYLSYLPKERVMYPLAKKEDARGSFTELIRTVSNGQISVNISKPGMTKGEHWHNSKWELFIVVSGHGLIRERRIGSDEIMEFEVSGDDLQAIHMLPGYTHSLQNLSDTEDLITVMWANEIFDPEKPDTFREEVGSL